MPRKFIAWGALAPLVALLTSCISLDVRLEIDREALATGTYEVSVTKEAAGLLGVNSPEDLERRLTEGEGGILPEGNSVEVGEKDGSYTMKVTLTTVPLTEDGLIAEVLDDGNVRFEFKNEATEEEAGSFGITNNGTIDMNVTMPGKVIEHEGFELVNERTLSYSGDVSEAVVLSATSESGGSGDSSMVPLIVLGVIAALVVISLIRNRKRSGEGSGKASPAVGGE